ncbi:bifunctional serine/threonine-protein kinase/formylglycine-generating enzyme family protein [Okeanomitos corallinicola TIOX110]|uniref:Bifunctional serine/threonine-protein kinase/formylglycine-generating enzyme family protein n=1 Tax=Okeanomitos corallinicola TIOX110 TaxID=3133117 RepID=A0ABZ2UX11_9CYAN
MRIGGRYEILEILGNGGFGITYKARDMQKPSKPICVVKELLSQHNNTFRMNFFQKEARILEALGTHSQIPHLLAYFEENEKFYIVQEFIQGQCLDREILPGKQLSEGYVIKLLQDVLEVLVFVHEQNVIHRDIKPPNLIRRQEDGKVCLIDFGIVKETDIYKSNGSVKTSIMAGTFGYMPSEQARGKTVFSSDIYALGITAIQALTGLQSQDIEEDPQTAELSWQHSVQVSNHLAAFLTKMVRRHHSLRYQNAQAALAELKKITPSLPTAILSNPVVTNPRDLYYQEASSLGQKYNGKFSPIILKRLENKRLDLGLSVQEAQEIRELVIQSYQQNQHPHQELKQGNRQQIIPPKLPKSSNPNIGINRSRANSQPQKSRSSAIKTQPFVFETAQLESKNLLFGLIKNREIQRSQKTAKLFIEELENGVILELIAISSGKFLMGSSQEEIESMDRGFPQHLVLIEPFLLGKYPITQAQWKAVSSLPKIQIDLDPDPSNFKGLNRPVEQISWYETQEFCARLSQKTGRLYRLPSEAEWEYACRAGTITPFYFGNTISTELANYNGEYIYGNGSKGIYRKETTDVGTFPANAFGLYDIHGNVWEWCQDGWYDNYIGAPNDGSAWLNENDNHPRRVLRGGSWSYRPVYCRSAYRINYPPVSKDQNHGFRVACSAKWNES